MIGTLPGRITIHIDFDMSRYLAQRFPPLCIPSNTGYTGVVDAPSMFMWPDDERHPNRQPGWQLSDPERESLKTALKRTPDPMECSSHETVFDVLKRLDEWLVGPEGTLKELPPKVVSLLSGWLADQWKAFSVEAPGSEYIWDFLSTLSDAALESEGQRVTVPPLIGRIEAYAATKVNLGNDEDGWETVREWLHDGEAVHLCDRLATVFSENRPQHDDASGDLKLGAAGKVQMRQEIVNPAELRIEYRGSGMARSWLDRMAGFGFWPAALPPSEHWLLRQKEVALPMAEHVVSLTIPSETARSLKPKLPQVWWTIVSGAQLVAEARLAVQPPLWLQNGFLRAALDWTRDKAWPVRGRTPEGQEIRYRLDSAEHLTGNHPDHRRLRAAISKLANQPSPLADNVDQAIFERLLAPGEQATLFASWQEAVLFAAELVEVNEHRAFEAPQALADMHRRISAIPEMVARARFQGEIPPFTMKNPDKPKEDEKRIGILFTGWLRQAEPDVEKWDPKSKKPKPGEPPPSGFYPDILEPVFGPLKKGSSTAAPARLFDLLEQTVSQALSCGPKLGLPCLGKEIRHLRDAGPGSAEWAGALDVVSTASRDGVAELLLTAKMLFEVRNCLTHGIVLEQPVNAGQVNIEHAESGSRLRLDSASLDYCLRLTVAFAHAAWTR